MFGKICLSWQLQFIVTKLIYNMIPITFALTYPFIWNLFAKNSQKIGEGVGVKTIFKQFFQYRWQMLGHLKLHSLSKAFFVQSYTSGYISIENLSKLFGTILQGNFRSRFCFCHSIYILPGLAKISVKFVNR